MSGGYEGERVAGVFSIQMLDIRNSDEVATGRVMGGERSSSFSLDNNAL